MATEKKSKKGLIIVAVILLIAIAAGIAFWVIPQMQQKQAAYDQAAAYLAEGNYRLAYKGFAELGSYKDAEEQAELATQQMQAAAQKHIDKAQELADMGFNMLAGLYLTAQLADEFQFTQEDYDKMAEMISTFYADAQTLYDAATAADEEQTSAAISAALEALAALTECSDPVQALEILSKLASVPLVEQLIELCVERGLFDDIPLAEIAEMAPFWVPVIDQYLAAMEDLDILELVGRP